MLRYAEKYGRTIDPAELLNSSDELEKITCKACNRIPVHKRLAACNKCKSNICEKCYQLAMSEFDDLMIDKENQMLEGDGISENS